MPRHCSIPGCSSRSSKEECRSLVFYHLPSNTQERQKWLVSIKRPITISKYTYVCSLHFEENRKTTEHPIPTIFPWSTIVKHRNSPSIRSPPGPVPKKQRIEASLTLSQAQEHIKQLTEQVTILEQQLQDICRTHVERFGLQRFQGSNDDILFYTGLPTYDILLCLYRYLEPLLPYLRYRPSKHSNPTHQLLSRQRLLQPIDELFLVLVRLRLDLLEDDLAHRFNASTSTVSRICTTWLPFLSQQLIPPYHMALSRRH